MLKLHFTETNLNYTLTDVEQFLIFAALIAVAMAGYEPATKTEEAVQAEPVFKLEQFYRKPYSKFILIYYSIDPSAV